VRNISNTRCAIHGDEKRLCDSSCAQAEEQILIKNKRADAAMRQLVAALRGPGESQIDGNELPLCNPPARLLAAERLGPLHH
jgi:hypothetical protein